jgi:hypothetical protein
MSNSGNQALELPANAKYPNVWCDRHPTVWQPGYVVCDHIRKPEDIHFLDPATSKTCGLILCSKCYRTLRADSNHECLVDDCRIWCVCCLRDAGIFTGIQ